VTFLRSVPVCMNLITERADMQCSVACMFQSLILCWNSTNLHKKPNPAYYSVPKLVYRWPLSLRRCGSRDRETKATLLLVACSEHRELEKMNIAREEVLYTRGSKLERENFANIARRRPSFVWVQKIQEQHKMPAMEVWLIRGKWGSKSTFET
jgi:hypothetical protein